MSDDTQDSQLFFRTAKRTGVPLSRSMGKPRNLFQTDLSPIPSNDLGIRPWANHRSGESGEGGGSVPDAPGYVTFSVATGNNPGCFDLTVSALPDMGDGPNAGDGLGFLTQLIVQINGIERLLSNAEPFIKTYSVNMSSENYPCYVTVRAESQYRPGPYGSEQFVVTKETDAPVNPPPTLIAPVVPRSVQVGVATAWKWSDYFTGAVTYVVAPGIPGGVSSGTGNVDYTIASPSEGNFSGVVTAYNADGVGTSTSFSLTVVAVVVPPAILQTLPNITVPMGGTINYPLADYFSGTDLSYSMTPASAKIGIVNGVLVNTAPLDAAIAATEYTITASNSGGAVSQKTTITVTAVQPAKIPANQVKITKSTWAYGAVGVWRKPSVKFTTFDPATKAVLGWSTGNPDANGNVPANTIETSWTIVDGEYMPNMTIPSSNGINSPRTDYSIFNETESTRATKFRVLYKNTVDGPWSIPSDPMTVPPVSVVQPSSPWLPVLITRKSIVDGGHIPNVGMQFQRVVAVDESGTTDLVFCGQDENNWTKTEDFGTTYCYPSMLGCFHQASSGAYVNMEDNIIAVMGGRVGASLAASTGGVWVSRDGGNTCTKVNAVRSGTQGFTIITTGGIQRINQNQMHRRPQNANKTLTVAQRPFYLVEQVSDGTGGSITAIYLWKSTDALASLQMVKQLNVNTFSNSPDNDGIYYIQVMEDGSILLCGKKGLFWAPDDGNYNFVQKLTGEVSSMSAKGTRVRAGRHTSPFNVWETANITTTAFTKLAGVGLPANYPVKHLGSSPANFNRFAVCDDNAAPYVSVDGGATFTAVKQGRVDGDEQWRWNLTGAQQPAGVYFHFKKELLAIAMTNQTFAKSTDGMLSTSGNNTSYFDGGHSKGIVEHFSNPDKFGVVQQDRTLQYGLEGFKWFDVSGLNKNTIGDAVLAAGGGGSNPQSNISGAGGVWLPGTKNQVMLAINSNQAEQSNVPVLAWNIGSNGEYNNNKVFNVGDTSRCLGATINPKNDNHYQLGAFKITNVKTDVPGDVNVSHSGHEYVGHCFTGGVINALWTVKGLTVSKIYTTTNDAMDNHTLVYTSSVALIASTLCVDPFNANAIYGISNKDGVTLIKISKSGSTWGETVVANLGTIIRDSLTTQMQGIPFTMPGIQAARMKFDWNKAGLMYASFQAYGMPNVLMSLDYGATWTDITDNAPRCMSFVYVLRTGVVLAGSSHGTWARPAPTGVGYPAVDNLNKQYNDKKAYYDLATTLPKPPV